MRELPVKLERGFLKSKVARRIFLLFITCALLPIVTLWLISSSYVTGRLEAQSRQRVHRTAKALGMEILGRLATLETELRMAGALFESGARFGTGSNGDHLERALLEHFDGLAILDDLAGASEIIGTIALPPCSDAELSKPSQITGARICTRSAPGAPPRIYLGVPLECTKPASCWLFGQIDVEFLWGADLPANSELLVLGPGRVPMLSTLGPVSLSQEAVGQMMDSSSGDFTWTHRGQEYVAGFWSMFLKAGYGAPSWTVVLSESRADVLAPVSQFRKMLPAVALLCLLIVVLLSFVQIRRSLVPLESLQRGTERIAEGRFDTRVVVNSGDEFQRLGESFNSMAAQLGRQFRTLGTLAEIDRAILSAVKEEQIIRTVLARIPDHFLSDIVAVAVLDEPEEARLYSRGTASAGEVRTEKVRVSPEDWSALSAGADGALKRSGHRIPAHLASLVDEGLRHCLLLPITLGGRVAGCITLGYRENPNLEEDDIVEARRLANQVAVALSNAGLVKQLEQANTQILLALARAVDANSPWTAGHSERVTAMAVDLAGKIGLSRKERLVIHRGGLLHDLGKIGVPNEILDKPGRLTDEEMGVMREHPRIGARILEPIAAYADAIPIVLYHHECYDGSGYPEGLSGENIPLHARILSLPDVFDALTSERPYRAPWSWDRAAGYIVEQSGRMFDPRLVGAFVEIMQSRGCREEKGAELCDYLHPARNAAV